MLVANQAILYNNTPQIASMIHMAYFIAIPARIIGLGMEDCVSYYLKVFNLLWLL
jgi:hypothetical protein